jgi:aminoglycoside phosphotransferase (APT) family kinase protein
MSGASSNAVVDSALLDFRILGDWMEGEGLPGGPFEGIRLLEGGTQNVLIRFDRGGRSYVLRRPPPHLRPASNEVLRRESRVLAALAGTEVRHPRFIAGCPDETVMGGAVFYLMEPVDGFAQNTGLPALHAGSVAIRHQMGLEAADAIAELGRVDYRAVGLEGFGRPDGFLERQVPRWTAELETYSKLEGYPGPEIPGLPDVARWLDEKRPTAFAPGIMHGDYHFANVMYAHDSARLVAIVDWEMCTIGDPLLDLGWLLVSAAGPLPGGPKPDPAAPPTLISLGGLPTREEIVRRYAAGSSRDLSAATWYEVLACFKLGIVLEGTHARACAGLAPRETGDRLHTTTMALFAWAHELIAKG